MRIAGTHIKEPDSAPGAARKHEATDVQECEVKEESLADSSEDEDFQAFQQMLPELLKEHRGEYALFVKRKFVMAGSLAELMRLARSEYPGMRFLVQPIQEDLPEVFLGGPRLHGR